MKNSTNTLELINLYKIYIYDRYQVLKQSNKQEYDNYDLAKIFEYYICIKLMEETNKSFYEYNDISPTFKEINKMSKNDTGIDCCDLENTIVQCKLRTTILGWNECGTFFGSQNIYDDIEQKVVVRWNNLILARNECRLSLPLSNKYNQKLFTDKVYYKKELINYCNNVLKNKPICITNTEPFNLRDYQIECINIINNQSKNLIISLPTGTGKNVIIINAFQPDTKYLILVPRIVLMEQLHDEICHHRPDFKDKIQFIGDTNTHFNKNKDITICVYNSIIFVEPYLKTFNKIFIDEAHHIHNPLIYKDENDIKNFVEKGYVSKIKKLSEYNNNVYLSATIDKLDGFDYYGQDIRTMIDQNYLCDYTINVPIFSNKTSNYDICHYLINNYNNIIIYCSTKEEGKEINQLLNTILPYCSKYIDSDTNKTERRNILDQYKQGHLSILVNVKILVEGFDAPITKGVCFFNLSRSKTAIIQIMGRALRKHPLKRYAQIILPYADKNNPTICHFLKILSSNDTRIKTSFVNKKIGGYISLTHVNSCRNDEIGEFMYTKVYNSLGLQLNDKELWFDNLNNCKKYMDTYGKRPSDKNDNEEINSYGAWLKYQLYLVRTNSTNWTDDIKIAWDIFYNQYKHCFLSYEEIWDNNLNKVKNFIDQDKRRPPLKNNDGTKNESYGWLSNQFTEAKGNQWPVERRNKWNDFLNQYHQYLLTDSELWHYTFNKVENHFTVYNKKPKRSNKNNQTEEHKNGKWLSRQISQYNNPKFKWDPERLQKLENLMEKYPDQFMKDYKSWYFYLNKTDEYIILHNAKPNYNSQDTNITLIYNWLNHQIKLSENKNNHWTNNMWLLWNNFVTKHEHYFIDQEDNWLILHTKQLSC